MAVEIGTAYVSVIPSARGFGAALGKEIGDPLEHEGRQAGDRAGRGFTGSFGNSLKSLAVITGSAFAALGIGSFVKGSVTAASDLNEELSKSNTIFGDQGPAIEEWASGAAKGFGQSKRGALQAAGTFGNLFDQLGIGEQQSATLSKGLTELATDFASFHNAAPVEVVDAMTAAFRGEYDALQRFVPTINAATVEQKALAMTGKATTKELTAQDKALAAQALIFEGAGQAAGDFDRTSGSLANQQRTLGAMFEDTKSKLGTKLLPVITQVAGFIIDKGIPAFERLGEFARTAFDWVRSLFASDSGSGFAGVLERIGEAARTVFDWLRANGPAILAAVREGIALVADWAREKLIPALSDLWEMFKSAFEAVVVIVQTTVTVVKDLWDRFGEQLVGRVKGVVEGILTQFRGILQILGGVFDLIKAILTGKWGEAWDAIKQILSGAVTAVLGSLSMFWNAITGLFEVAKGLISAAWSLLWNSLKTLFSDVFGGLLGEVGVKIGELVGFFVGLPGQILGALGDVASWLIGKGADIVVGLITGYLGVIDQVTSFFAELGGRIIDWFGAAASWLVGKGGDILRGLLAGLGGMIGAVAGFIGAIGGQVIAWIGDAGSWLVGKGRDVIQGFLNGIGELFGSVGSRIAEIAGAVTGAIGDAGSWLYGAGQDLIRGLLNGIRNMAGAAADAARAVVSNAVNAAKGALGIGSPSRVFVEIGENTIAGFVLGVRGSTPSAVSQMGRFAGAVTSADLRLAPGLTGLSGPSVAAAGTGSITQNFYGPISPPDAMAELGWLVRTQRG